MDDSKSWETIKEFYMEKFGTEENLVELMSNYDILLACVSGVSNAKICYHLDISEETLVNVLNEYLSFNGWETDLDVNPYMLYKKSGKSYSELVFQSQVEDVSKLYSDDEIETMFRICSVFYRLEDTLRNEWV